MEIEKRLEALEVLRDHLVDMREAKSLMAQSLGESATSWARRQPRPIPRCEGRI